jgi:hypothetical protein
MRKARLEKLELKTKTKTLTGLSWRYATEGVAIRENNHLLNLLQSLGRKPIYSDIMIGGLHILIDPKDRTIIERMEGESLYLVGLNEPHQETPPIIFVNGERN